MTVRVELPGRAGAGDLVRGDLLRRTAGKRRWSTVEHVVRVGHRYGPDGSMLWGRPLCGGEPGRVGSAGGGIRLCARCRRLADAAGIVLALPDPELPAAVVGVPEGAPGYRADLVTHDRDGTR